MIGMLLGGAALGAAGNLISGFGKRKGLRRQEAGLKKAQDLYLQESRRAEGQLQPFRQVGLGALGSYRDLLSPEGQSEFFEAYQQSPMYQAFRDQAEEAALRGASATGGLRTGQANVALSSIAPQLAQQAIQQRLQGLQNLYGTGFGASGQMAGIGQQGASNLANLRAQRAGVRGAATSVMPQTIGQTAGQLGGLAMHQGLA